MSWIIKVHKSFVERSGGSTSGKLTDDRSKAHKWKYKKDAESEAIFWIGQFTDGKPYVVSVEKAGVEK